MGRAGRRQRQHRRHRLARAARRVRGARRQGIQTGTPVSGGGITTAGNLVFIGASIDGYFRAFDARNGKKLWSDKLPAPAHGVPSTYMGRDGKQCVVVGANGGGFFGSPTSDEVIAHG